MNSLMFDSFMKSPQDVVGDPVESGKKPKDSITKPFIRFNMASWLIALIVVFSYSILAGVTGGLAERMNWGWDVALTLAMFSPIGIFIILIGIIWRWCEGVKIWS